MFDLYLIKTDEIKINDTEKVQKLKSEYLELNKLDSNNIKLRLFFGGTELNDEEELYKYKIKTNFTVQLSKKEITLK